MHKLHIQIEKNNNLSTLQQSIFMCPCDVTRIKLHFTIRNKGVFFSGPTLRFIFKGEQVCEIGCVYLINIKLQIGSVMTVKCRHGRLSTGAPQQTTSYTHCLLSHSSRVTSCLGSLRFLGRQSTTAPRRESGRGVDLEGVDGGFPTSAPEAGLPEGADVGESSLLSSLSMRCKTMADIAIAAAAIKNKTHMKKVCRPQLFWVAILIIHRCW